MNILSCDQTMVHGSVDSRPRGLVFTACECTAILRESEICIHSDNIDVYAFNLFLTS